MRDSLWVRLLGLVLVLIGLCGVLWTNFQYHAQPGAIVCIEAPAGGVAVAREKDSIVFMPEDPSAGVIFYPGGFVAPESYAPLMEALAQRGLLCVLMPMPLNLAILDTDAAAGMPEQYPQVDAWYMAGHSLGGYAAGEFLGDTHADYAGLILLGGYVGADLTRTDLSVLSVYGSEDGVMNRESYEEGLKRLPQGYTEVVIEGGCHAYFGDYGAQKGDGEPGLTCGEQTMKTAALIEAFVKE